MLLSRKILKDLPYVTCILLLISGPISGIHASHVTADTLQTQATPSGITGRTDGIIHKGQPKKQIPGNGQAYQIAQGITVSGNQGSPEWIFTADETAIPNTTFTVYVCGIGNSYVIYTITVYGAGTYVLDASQYGSFNQGLSLEAPEEQPATVSGSVRVHYVDEAGRPIAAVENLETLSWLEGEPAPQYQTLNTPLYRESITYNGERYKLDTSLIPSNANGFYLPNQTITITYVYKRPVSAKLKGDVIVHYVDEHGKNIANDQRLSTLSWFVGETAPAYHTLDTPLYQEKINYEGKVYELDVNKLPSNANGFYLANQTLSVTYIYKLRAIPENPEEASDVPRAKEDSLPEAKADTSKLLDNSYTKEKLPKTGEKSTSNIISLIGSGILLALYCMIRRTQ